MSPLQLIVVNLLPKKAMLICLLVCSDQEYLHRVTFSLLKSILKYIIQRERQLFDVQNNRLNWGLYNKIL